MALKDTLKEAREDAHLSKAEVARRLHIPYTTYNGYETGYREPRMDTLGDIARTLNVSIGFLLGYESKDAAEISSLLRNKDYANLERKIGLPVGSIIPIPPEEEAELLRQFDAERMKKKSPSIDIDKPICQPFQCGSIFAQKIKGHSMEPRIYDADIVIVRKQDEVEDGDIAVVEIIGEGITTKQVFHQDGGILLTGLNNAVFTPRFVLSDQIKIIGKVIEVRGNVEEWRITRKNE